ncbi:MULTISPECIES: cyclic nucleotide-binding domain-containing protein [unclassified Clostridium]|uniref:cyclic nucleotide-binding domain-containing protein n=1 Tax=unclassified Clostridium TaxID=2614128 RepID=UPI0013FA33F4|nr:MULTISPECIES: cyclic nucleotide-binding domain-containing protein [unclassified Clostridium]NFR87224.1 cyclic nucleotide-binding domain-containing protein [Clostridium botulinum]NFR88732.1 cyclic nucleotide-binding domain-containing protein [Clostridium botulinum]
MIKVNDFKKIHEYIEKYKINDMFSIDMREYMSLYMFARNEYICKEEEVLNKMFFVVDGKAKVYKNLENGKSLLLSFYNPFTVVGDIEFLDNNSADCNVQVIKDTYCIVIEFSIIKDKLMDDCKFLRNRCKYLGEKLRCNSKNSSINLLYPLENRLASYILAFVNGDSNLCFTFEGGYNETAELLGTSYRHLNRTLNKFCSEGIIRKDDKSYIVNDINKLKYLSGDLYR